MHQSSSKTLVNLSFVLLLAVIPAFCHSEACSGDLLKDKVCKDSIQPTCSNRVVRSVYDDDCEQIEKCVCPSATPLRFNDRCYKTFECPKKSADGISNNRTGHNFVIPGKVNGRNEVYGMHISALRLSPHWYHGIALFQFTDSSCAETVKNAHAKNPAIFISINYRVPIKLADLLTTGNTFLATIGFGAGSVFTPITQCNLRVKKVLDLRRYKSDEPYPGCQKFLLFGDGDNAYISHIPTRCKETQQIMMLKSVPSELTVEQLKSGVVAWLPEVKGEPLKDASGEIIDPLLKSAYKAYYKCDYESSTDDDVIDGLNNDDAAAEVCDNETGDEDHCTNLRNCKSTKVEISVKYPLDTFIINIMCP
ncbi:uncharacterized protein LOC135685202 [Rhopilema esculentum]|uniref:uncharacterized protein LOC135685202 n=1 Tax=Rhopilema esculentum TaxID=499914 RepID=UPI0031E3C6E7|eukprot:gene17341-8921_t